MGFVIRWKVMLTDRLCFAFVVVGPAGWWPLVGVAEVDGGEAHDTAYDEPDLQKSVRPEIVERFAETGEAQNQTYV